MRDELTAKQEAFAQELAKGSTNADAYRRAYNAAGRSQNSLYVSASELASSPKIAVRVEALRARMMARHDVNTDSLLAEADAAFRIAACKRDASGMIQATRLKAMLTGNLVKERDNARSPLTDVTDEAVRDELLRLRTERESASRAVH